MTSYVSLTLNLCILYLTCDDMTQGDHEDGTGANLAWRLARSGEKPMVAS
jgi:hypothetical protein